MCQTFFTPLKTNLSINPTTLAFRIVDNRVIFENHPVEINPEDALSDDRREETSVLGHAVRWLREALEDCPVPATDIFRMARDNHISDATLRRAKERLKVESAKGGYSTGWKMAMETSQRARNIRCSRCSRFCCSSHMNRIGCEKFTSRLREVFCYYKLYGILK